MRILMVAPHPVYTPRGTPISVLNRCRALSELGHEVDLVTYGIGEDVPVTGLRWTRARVPGLNSVGVGISWRKLPLDIAVLAKAAWVLVRHRSRYEVLHTHEEAGVLGLLARLVRIPHVYDMGNDLSVVAQNYGFGPRHPLTRLAAWAERATVRHCDVVIAHFPAIKEAVRSWGLPTPVEVVFNVPHEPGPDPALSDWFRSQWSPDGETVVLYTGTLETYQGLEDLVDAMADPAVKTENMRLVVAGGQPQQVESLRARAQGLHLGERAVFVGQIPQETVSSALAAADILVSPRTSGNNTPLKIFAYLKAGRPVLATRTASHTQVLDDRSALLVSPGPAPLAAGLVRLQQDTVLRQRLSAGAAQLAGHYSPEGFREGVRRAYAMAVPDPVPPPPSKAAAVRELPVWELPVRALARAVREDGGHR